jgi:ParB-like chromosome segregation protein Spo0J
MSQWHPYAKLFPRLPEDRLQELADDIRENGLRQPIVIDRQERILDGRNREVACNIAGVEPTYEPFLGSDHEALKLVISLNIHRRHLSESQRAMIAAEVATKQKGSNQHASKVGRSIDPSSKSHEVSIPEAASALNVGEASVKRARKVREKGAPELQQAVTDGKMSVSRAAQLAELPAKQQVDALSKPRPARRPDKQVETAVKHEFHADDPPVDAGTARQRDALAAAHEAIEYLKRIPGSNPLLPRAYQIVGDFISHNAPSVPATDDIQPQINITFDPSDWSPRMRKDALVRLSKFRIDSSKLSGKPRDAIGSVLDEMVRAIEQAGGSEADS